MEAGGVFVDLDFVHHIDMSLAAEFRAALGADGDIFVLFGFLIEYGDLAVYFAGGENRSDLGIVAVCSVGIFEAREIKFGALDNIKGEADQRGLNFGVGGINHTITTTIAVGQGFTAVMVSWLAKFNPITMIFTSFLIVFLERGASEVSTIFGLNQSFSDILTGIILFFIIGCEFFISYKINFRKKEKKEVKENV